jgi:hypothetical protein
VSEPIASQTEQQTRPLMMFCLVQWLTLTALAWKVGAFIQMWRCYFSTPLRQEFFPSVMESSILLVVAYVGAITTLGIAAMTVVRRRRIFAAWGTLVMMSILCIHQGSYNDMTFATAWWTSVWSVWLAGRMDIDSPERLVKRAAFLSRCIISMILLGGAVGKWTGEYWSGQALYEIYFIDRDFWFFNLLGKTLDAETLRTAAKWYSRQVILIETVCGFGLWLLPPRWAATIAVFVLTSIAVFSNFNLFSVLLSVIGLATAGYFVESKPKSLS